MTLFGNTAQSDYEQKCELVRAMYNRYAKQCNSPEVRKLTMARKTAMEELVSLSSSDLKQFFRECKKAIPFFKSFAGFSFDWLVNKENYVKVMEGKYRPREFKQNPNVSEIKSEINYRQRTF